MKALCALQHLATLVAPCPPFRWRAAPRSPSRRRSLAVKGGVRSTCARTRPRLLLALRAHRVLGLTKYGVLRNKLRKTRILYNSCRRRYSVQAVTNSYIVPWLALRARTARPPQLVQNARLVQRNKHSEVGIFRAVSESNKNSKKEAFLAAPQNPPQFFFTQNSITFCIIATLAKTAKKAPAQCMTLCSYFLPTAARSRPSAPFARAEPAQRLGKKYLIIGFNSFLKCHA